MDSLKVCFIGIGSIAKRHIANLQEICCDRKIKLNIDAVRKKGGNIDGIDNVYNYETPIPDDYDVIFITNPTVEHFQTIKRFHKNGKHFFIEKPVVGIDNIEELSRLRLKDDTVYYVACPLRYNAVIKYINDNISRDDIIAVRSIASSYLPDWRPDQDYRDNYSAHKNMGGGVDIDLVHEWDYLTFLFGFPKRVYSMAGKKSSLEIDSNDYAIYIAEYDKIITELHLDYFGKESRREVEIFTKDDVIIGDILRSKVRYLKSGKEIVFNEERNDYQKKELIHFFELITCPEKRGDDINRALKVLKLTQGVLD